MATKEKEGRHLVAYEDDEDDLDGSEDEFIVPNKRIRLDKSGGG